MSNFLARGKRPTQADVARLAGVSQALVSYVLNGNPSVSVPPETRARIVEAVQTLGYVPNNTARSLRTNKTYTVAAIIPDITNPFYPALERGIQDVADEHNYDLIIYNTDGSAEKEAKCLRSVMQGRVDGIVAVLFHQSARALFPLLAVGMAVVRVEAMPRRAGEMPLDNLFVDNCAAAQSAVRYLLSRGYRRIALLYKEEGPGQPRAVGYQQAMTLAGLPLAPELMLTNDFTERGGYHAIQTLLQLAERPEAIFAANDLMAIGALLALQEAKLHVPADIAVMGFDDIPTARLVSPPLTTVAQSQDQLGRRAAEMLFERLEQHAPAGGRCEEMPYRLVLRQSA